MTSEARRREVGESDAPVEDAIDESFQQIVSEGSQRLHRTWRVVLVTGTVGGLEIGVGVMADLPSSTRPATTCSPASPSASAS